MTIEIGDQVRLKIMDSKKNPKKFRIYFPSEDEWLQITKVTAEGGCASPQLGPLDKLTMRIIDPSVCFEQSEILEIKPASSWIKFLVWLLKP
jgi:hypothetical protein